MVYLVKHFVHFICVLECVLRMFVSLEQNVNKNLNKVTDEKAGTGRCLLLLLLCQLLFLCAARVCIFLI